MRRMLTVAALVAPLLCALGLAVRSSPPTSADIGVIVSAGLLLPALRLSRRPSLRVRTLTVIGFALVAGIYFLARLGFAAGVSVMLVTTSVIGVICLGRRVGFALVGASALAHVAVGVLVTRGALILDVAEVDPLHLQNWIRMAATTSLVASLLVLVVDFVIRQVEASSHAATGALSQLRRLHDRVERSEEEERRFLAHELHDELGQTLTAIKLRLQMRGEIREPGVIETATEAAVALVDQLITRVRRISGALRPPLLDEIGLVPAVRAFLDSQTVLTGLAIQLEAEEELSARLPPDIEIACFRVVQESITNAVRHASARSLRVRINRDAHTVSLAIQDDGRGFDAGATLEAAAAAGHLGVVGMHERVRARGGILRLHSRPGSGTTIEADLPIRA